MLVFIMLRSEHRCCRMFVGNC